MSTDTGLPLEVSSVDPLAASTTFDDWLASYPPLYYLRVPSDSWHALTREDRAKLVAHNLAVEPLLADHLAAASLNDAFVTLANDVWKSLPMRLRQKVTAYNAELVNEMCESRDILTLPADVWRLLTAATRRLIVGHNRAILNDQREFARQQQ
jgi:hypothetical protein